MLVFGIVMLIIQGGNAFGPPPPSTTAMAFVGLFSYIAFAGVAYWLEKKRR
jgi:hypothetical protein